MNIILIVSIVLFWAAGFLSYFLNIKKYIHIMQLEGYKNRQFFYWLSKNLKDSIIWPSGIFLVLIIIYFSGLYLYWDSYLFIPLILGFVPLSLFYIYQYIKKKFKKPLVYTPRLIRLLIANILLFIIEILIVLNTPSIATSFSSKAVLWFGLALVLTPFNVILSNVVVYPLERSIQKYYINSAARKILSMKDLINIGITGSFGKTSTKFILKTILSEKYKVLATPDSYNTTMGTTRVIREILNDVHEVFISEMGARNIGDIAEICNIVKPDMAIITSIGKQHLETFKTINNVAKTKYELIKGLKEDGTGFFPSDNDYCYELYKGTTKKKVLYGLEKHIEEVDITAEDVVLSDKGSTFVLTGRDGKKIECTTKLLGKHNVLNILGCAAIAKYLGMTMEEIADGVSKIEPIPHRLQILSAQNGTIVIDDAFNSNPVGSKMALEVLSRFKGRKIIVTPGMVELGSEEFDLNKDFGREIAKVVDIAVLVGKKRTEAIQQGLVQEGFSQDNLHVVNSLDEATVKLAAFVRSGDIILFENDLPDNYDEN